MVFRSIERMLAGANRINHRLVMQQYRTTKRQTDYLNKLGICKRSLAYDSKSSRWYDMNDLLGILPKHIRRGNKIYNLTMKYLYDGSSDGCVAGYERDDTPRKYAYIHTVRSKCIYRNRV